MALLMAMSAHTASAQFNLDGLRDAVQDALDKAKDAADKAKDAVPDLGGLGGLGDKAKEALQGAADKAKEAADKVDLPDLEELADKVKDKVPAAGGAGLFSCPPKGFDSVRDFNLKAYAAAPWYIQAQVRGRRGAGRARGGEGRAIGETGGSPHTYTARRAPF